MTLLIVKSLVSNLSPTLSSLVWVSPSDWPSFLKGCTEIDSTSCQTGWVCCPVETVSSNHHPLYMLLFLSCPLAHTGWHSWHLSQQFQTCELLIWLWMRLVIPLSNNVCIISVSVCTFFSKLKLIPKYNSPFSQKFPQEILWFPILTSSLAYSLSHSLL